MDFNFNEKYSPFLNILKNSDSTWMKRKISTELIFKYLTKATILNTGISTCIDYENEISHVAMIKARKKIPENFFYGLNTQLHQSLKRNNIYAIDGSKDF